MLVVDKFSRVPVYEQIVQQMEKHILIGEFSPEQALPSVRTLALSLGINPNTLQKAYAELERRGLCFSSPGSGRFVSRSAPMLLRERSRKRLMEFGNIAAELYAAGISREDLIQCVHAACAAQEEEKDD